MLPCRVRVDAVEGHPCGQFSYPTLQYVPEDGRVFVAYTVLFLPSAMSPDCKVSSPKSSRLHWTVLRVWTVKQGETGFSMEGMRPLRLERLS